MVAVGGEPDEKDGESSGEAPGADGGRDSSGCKAERPRPNFYYETLSSPEIACKLAKQAFDNAIADLNGLEEY